MEKFYNNIMYLLQFEWFRSAKWKNIYESDCDESLVSSFALKFKLWYAMYLHYKRSGMYIPTYPSLLIVTLFK